MAQINEMYFERVFNLGNYETFRVGLRATISEHDDKSKIAEQLDAAILKVRRENCTRAT
jgi:hypothetical protein